MPLQRSASKQAFSSNIKAEMAAGKPQPQAVAIAYSEKQAANRGHTAKQRTGKVKTRMGK